MSRPLLALIVGGSALFGGVAGASVALWAAGSRSVFPSGASTEVAAMPADAAPDKALAARVEVLERRLGALRAPGSARAQAGALVAAQRAADSSPSDSALVDDPVFEAAVLDVLERAEEERSSERETRRDERRKARDERWANGLAEELGLTALQKGQLLEIRSKMAEELRTRLAADGGTEPSRAERRARAENVRSEAERKLQSVLDARQRSAYEKLDPDLRLFRGPRPDRSN